MGLDKKIMAGNIKPMMKTKNILGVLLLLILAVFAFGTLDANATVQTTGQTYDQATGNFTVSVEASEPYVVWRTFDFMNWEPVSGVRGAGRRTFTDTGVGWTHAFAFYHAMPKGKHPNNGTHWGWTNHPGWM